MANALQQIIRDRLDSERWSYGEVARRGNIPRSTVHHLATADHMARMPQPATLEGLALGLGLPLGAIRQAAAEACGIHLYAAGAEPPRAAGGTSADPDVEVLIASLQRLSSDDRRHVAALVESLLNRTPGTS
ncbi:transcriptional regulator [Streptomyces avermitilis]|uniref:transcriptional regulator n=1 Tax=Streptomyces avermitilis TaxID=33903 RepID=UPI0033A69EB7